jgi:hypothetical protein
MPATVSCPHCASKLRLPDELPGRAVCCPRCGTTFEVDPPAPPPAEPWPGGPAPATRPEAPPEAPPRRPRLGDVHDDLRPCPACGLYVHCDADRCRFCGEPLAAGGGDVPPAPRARMDAEPHRGGLVLGTGVASLVTVMFFPPAALVLGVVAWVMGQRDLRRIRAGEMDPDGRGPTTAGWICGILGAALGALLMLFCGMIMAFIFMAAERAVPPPRPAPAPGPVRKWAPPNLPPRPADGPVDRDEDDD